MSGSKAWESVGGAELAQGDWINECVVPSLPVGFRPSDLASASVSFDRWNLIVVTQSCDLEQQKVQFAALCQILSLEEFESASPAFKAKGAWEQVRQGRREGLHLLPSPTDPQNNRSAQVVDFRRIFSLPIDYLSQHAAGTPSRWRLRSPFLEHFSQALARFYMRVGLPTAIPPFK
jgi:hypothetical protein